jgi:hypothetical protein
MATPFQTIASVESTVVVVFGPVRGVDETMFYVRV